MTHTLESLAARLDEMDKDRKALEGAYLNHLNLWHGQPKPQDTAPDAERERAKDKP